MASAFTINQPGGAGAGVLGQARKDIWQNIQVDLVCATVEASYLWEFMVDGIPPGSTAVINNPTLGTANFTPDVVGSYRVRLTTNGGGTGNTTTKVISVTKDNLGAVVDNGIRKPAYDERPPENNFGGNSRGTAPDYEALVDYVNTLSSGATQLILFRPGSVTAGNSYATWPEVMTAFAATKGMVQIAFDGQDGAVSIPAGTYDFEWRAEFIAITYQFNTLGITVVDGAECQNVRGFKDLEITCQAIGGNINFTWGTNPVTLYMINSFISGQGDGTGYAAQFDQTVCALYLLNGSRLVFGTSAPLEITAFHVGFIYVDSSSEIEANTIEGAGTVSVFSLGIDATIGAQPGIGTFNNNTYLRKHLPALPDTKVYVGVAGAQPVDDVVYTTVGVIDIDPSILPGTNGGLLTQTITFKATLRVLTPGTTVSIHLINEVSTEVTSSSITSTVTAESIPERVSAALAIAAAPNIENTRKAYQVQIKRNGGVGGDLVLCHSAYIEVAYATA